MMSFILKHAAVPLHTVYLVWLGWGTAVTLSIEIVGIMGLGGAVVLV